MSAAIQSSVYSITPDHHFHPYNPSDNYRNFIQICHKVALKYGFQFEVASQNWLCKFSVGKVHRLIHGFDLGLNSSVTAKYCGDKASCSTLLSYFKIPHIEHRLFVKPGQTPAIWNEIMDYGRLHHFNLVCKPKIGSSGIDVVRIRSQQELEIATHNMFEKYKDLCLCPFYDIEYEYRLIMLNGEPQMIFKKIRPQLVGDGTSTIMELFSQFTKTNEIKASKFLKDFEPDYPLNAVLEEGKKINLTWKHNLCGGASSQIIDIPQQQKVVDITASPTKRRKGEEGKIIASSDSDVEEDTKKIKEIIALAKKTTTAIIGIFVSVDIACLKSNAKPVVVEVNNAVMAEHVARQNGAKAQRIVDLFHEKAICQVMDTPYREIDLPPRTTRSNRIITPFGSPLFGFSSSPPLSYRSSSRSPSASPLRL